MTYKEFLAHGRKMQRQYITSERRKHHKAKLLRAKYESAMRALNLHPLDGFEIYDRLRQLDKMACELPDKYGDTAANRMAYEMHHEEVTP